jgi:TET-associated glycosyltransferase-like protein
VRIYIPTRGRVEYQHTLRYLPKEWRARTVLVCPKSEVVQHLKNWKGLHGITPQPDPNMTIAAKRAWIFKTIKHDKILMMDDDLRFAIRRKTLPSMKGFHHSSAEVRGTTGDGAWARAYKKDKTLGALEIATEEHGKEIGHMLGRVEKMLQSGIRHGGIAPRLMNNNFGCEFIMNSRAMYALAYHVPTLLKHCKLGRIEHREDFDYTLQLMRAGFENAIYCWGVCEQARLYNASGGASLERTMKASNADAYKLAKLHPGLVQVKMKDYKQSVPRAEVVVQWAKAAAEGQNDLL